MGDWVEVTKKMKKEPEKKTQFSNIRNKTPQTNTNTNSNTKLVSSNNIKTFKSEVKKYNEKDMNLIFEDTFDQCINDEFDNLFKYLKPNSDLLKNVYSSEVIDFFYNYFDIESSVKITEDYEEVKNEYYSDDEYF